MKRPVLLLLPLFLLLTALPARACMWDRDTLAMEGKRFPELAYIITGRFERNPPLYYQMRLKRVTAELARTPARLDLYDDAAVSCDRLGDADEAIRWMAKKRAAIDRLPADAPDRKEQEYRYWANLGTFHAHRWIRNGKNRTDKKDLDAARESLEQALKINPDAHFGREKYQLWAIEWLIDEPKDFQGKPQTLSGYLNTKKVKTEDAIRGLSGLIVLGNAWESVDVFAALREYLHRVGTFQHLSNLRVKELIKEGKKSLWTAAPPDEESLIMALHLNHSSADPSLVGGVEKKYAELRGNAKAWHYRRETFMMTRLREGKHPDTDADFWTGYQEIPPAPLDLGMVGEFVQRVRNPNVILSFFSVAMVGSLVGILVIAAQRWRRSRLTPPPAGH